MPKRTPLAWLSLVDDRRRLVASLLGVGFAVILMFVEVGFLYGIYDSVTRAIEVFDADLVMVNRLKDDTNPMKPFPRERLEQARGFDGVAAAYPLYLERSAIWRNPSARVRDQIRVYAFDPAHPVFEIPEVRAQQHLLSRLDVALADSRARDVFGGLGTGAVGELQGRRTEIVGNFPLGTDMEVSATLLVSDRQLAAASSGHGSRLQKVEFGLIHLQPGADAAGVKATLQAGLLDDVDVMTKAELIERIHGFWRQHQPAGAIFGAGLVVGFAIGLMVCYQVLFNDISDHLPELATLKAMGYTDRYLLGLVLRQGVYLALLAFGIGLAGAWIGYAALERITGLELRMSAERAAAVFVLSVAMCAAAAALAVRRAFAADPAELF
jgi:putative ABC transport system permease protein